MPHQFRRKPNKHGKTPLVGIEPRTYWSQSLIPPPRCHYAIKPWAIPNDSYVTSLQVKHHQKSTKDSNFKFQPNYDGSI
ncbi:hypothetical protein Hanom_Chr07g00582451 [Helianthus anomalus]